MIKLDSKIKDAINSLTNNEVATSPSYYSFNHELLWYGLHSIVHIHIMNSAKEIPQGKISLDDFIKKYDIVFDEREGFKAKLSTIEAEGIFIPNIAYSDEYKRENATVRLFNRDYGNRIRLDSWENKNYAWNLIYEHKWKPADLQNKKFISKGIRFAKEMWETSVKGFEETKNGFENTDSKIYSIHETNKVTDLGEKLIQYYSSIVDDLTPKKQQLNLEIQLWK